MIALLTGPIVNPTTPANLTSNWISKISPKSRMKMHSTTCSLISGALAY